MGRMLVRSTAAILAFAGIAALAWSGLTVLWGEPFTAIAAARAQADLRRELAVDDEGRTAPSLRAAAAAYRAGLERGDAIGRIVVPRLDLDMVVVEGTSSEELARGPGHYRRTSLPGLGRTTAIAGHRTTYLAPFRDLDELERGDTISLVLPYGTFRYVVSGTRIVDDEDWSIVDDERFEKLVLSACHPVYSSAQRIVVSARLAGV
jgi:sortase A